MDSLSTPATVKRLRPTTRMRCRAQTSLRLSAPNMHGKCACRHSTVVCLCPILGRGFPGGCDALWVGKLTRTGSARNLRAMLWLIWKICQNSISAEVGLFSRAGHLTTQPHTSALTASLLTGGRTGPSRNWNHVKQKANNGRQGKSFNSSQSGN